MAAGCIGDKATRGWGLTPSAGRPQVFGSGYAAIKEERLYREFRREAPRWERHLSTGLEFLALGQHYGLPTRLLDWSTNPLVGAWFACVNKQATDGRLHMLRVSDALTRMTQHSTHLRRTLPCSWSGCRQMSPGSPRSRACSRCTQSRQRFGSRKILPICIQLLDIPSAEKPYFLQMLHILGVNHARLMVDLAGHCSTLAWQYKTWP